MTGGGRSKSSGRSADSDSLCTLEISVSGEGVSVSESYVIRKPDGKNAQVFTVSELPSEISVSVNVSIFRDGDILWETKDIPTVLLYPGDNYVYLEMIKAGTDPEKPNPDNPNPENPDPEKPSITDAEYTVNHLVQRLSDDRSSVLDEYETRETERLSGKSGGTTNAAAKNYEGFTAQSFEQKPINADGSTAVEIRYKRKTVTLTFDYDDGNSGSAQASGKYGTSVTAPQSPTKTGYTFSLWSPEVPETFPAESQTYTAQWTSENKGSSGSIEITTVEDLEVILKGKKDSISDLSLSTSGETVYSISVSHADGLVDLAQSNMEAVLYNGGVEYADSSVKAIVSSGSETDEVIITVSGGVAPGSYQLLVTFTYNGKSYQTTFDLSAKETL